ncbi:hypothetical protein BDN72DRAFT_111501 [Pluteus cervinus]|uniref:Uncharacterized protein n=1 Tax=Pluteus cervinus TaxID=181527 RepID=A0ACD3AQK4_9AGAR|nr:hypothetical protein BDN72DRAFT_111501 [Pluteus cervinus]
MCIAITSVPPEVWDHIIGMLTFQELTQLTLAHRVFLAYVRPIIWQQLSLCTLDPRPNARARAIIREPKLALHVRHLRLRPGFSINYRRTPTNLWVCKPSIRTWIDVFEGIKWKSPVKSWSDFFRSRQSIATALQIAPLLTNISRVTITASFSNDYQPNQNPYYELWTGLKASRIRCLEVRFGSHNSLRVFSSVLRTSSIGLEQLEALSLQLTLWGSSAPQEFQKNIQILADVGRGSLRSLLVNLNTPHPIQSALINGLGFFPNLIHFSGTFYSDFPHACVTEFLLKHRPTLVCLSLDGNQIHRMLPIILCDSKHTSVNSAPLRLTCIRLWSSDRGMTERIRSSNQLTMSAHADTLTTLSIGTRLNPRLVYHGFTYNEVEEIILSLHKPGRGVLLRRLKLPLEYLSPEIINLMSSYLNNLDTLGIAYYRLVSQEDKTAGARVLKTADIDKLKCSTWSLRRVEINKVVRRLSDIKFVRDLASLRFLSSCIPNLQVGPIDWTDVHTDLDRF